MNSLVLLLHKYQNTVVSLECSIVPFPIKGQFILYSLQIYFTIIINTSLDLFINKMGNSIQQKSSLLVKNWVKQSNNTYRNKITQELIDEYSIEYQSEEEMIANHKQLMGRANINHPNVIKLIYFSQSQKGCCGGKVYAHKVFVEHQNQRLAEYLTNFDEKGKGECFCCPLVNAFNVLTEKYGHFRVKEDLVFLASQTKWHKQDKKTVKVWINSRLQSNRPQSQCLQQEMCRSFYQILQKLNKTGICDKIKNIPQSINKVYHLVEQIYKTHNNTLQKQSQRKKRVSSTYSIPNQNIPTMLKVNQSSHDTLVFKNNRQISNFIGLEQNERNLNKTTEIFVKRDDMETMKKIIPSTTTKKAVIVQNKSTQPPVPFFKPTSRINFAYNDIFSTPKQNKSFHQQLNTSSPIIIQEKKVQPNSKPQQPIRKLERLQTVNIKVQHQVKNQQKCSLNAIQQQSQQTLKKKLQEIVQSSNHIASSPFLIDVNQPQYQSKEILSQPYFIRNLDTEPIVVSQENVLDESNFPSKQVIPQQMQGQPQNRFYADPSKIPLSQSLQDSADEHQNDPHKDKAKTDKFLTAMQVEMAYEGDQSYVEPIPKFGSMGIRPPVLHHTQSNFSINYNKPKERQEQVASYYQASYTNSEHEHSKLDQNYNKYLSKFNQVVNPTMSPRSKFSSGSKSPPFESLPSHSSQGNNQFQKIPHPKTAYNKHNSLTMEESLNRRKSKSKPSVNQNITVNNPKDGEIESLYNESQISQREKKAKIIERIENTQKIIRENRKKLQKIQLQKELQRQKEIIKKQMQTLLKNNLMADESNRIKEKVKHKKATFAQLKAQASKILEDFSF